MPGDGGAAASQDRLPPQRTLALCTAETLWSGLSYYSTIVCIATKHKVTVSVLSIYIMHISTVCILSQKPAAETAAAIPLPPPFLIHLILLVDARHCKHAELLVVELLQNTVQHRVLHSTV